MIDRRTLLAGLFATVVAIKTVVPPSKKRPLPGARIVLGNIDDGWLAEG